MNTYSNRIIIESHHVPAQAIPARLSNYCIGLFKSLPSRNSVKNAIKNGSLLINGITASTGTWVTPGSIIELAAPEQFTRPIYRLKLEILYEDNHIAVIHKPAGIPVNGNRFKTIENSLPFSLIESPEMDALPRPLCVHRLDAQTSGILLAAKTASSMKLMGLKFQERSVKKRYMAIAAGHIQGSGVINEPIGGREAVTRYNVLKSRPGARLSLVELFPETGRTHQLRIHLAGIGCPILGDSLYGVEGYILKRKGLFLCAAGVSFDHPVNNTFMDFSIQHPPKFDRVLAREELSCGSSG